MKALIAYYTRAGENYFNGAIRSIDKGNTEVIAEKLQDLTGGRSFSGFSRRCRIPTIIRNVSASPGRI